MLARSPLRWSVAPAVLLALGALVGPVALVSAQEKQPDPESLAKQNGDVFDEVWQIIRDTHPDPSINLAAWNDTRIQMRQRALSARDDAALRTVLSDMLETLGESHFAIIPNAVSGTAEATGGWSGLTLQVIGGVPIVTRVAPNSPAQAAGCRNGWQLVSSDGDSLDAILKPFGQPRTSLERLARDRAIAGFVGGRPGMSPEYLFLDESQEPHKVAITFDDPPGEIVVLGNLPPLPAEVESRWLTPEEIRALGADPSRTGRVGYLRFSIWMTALASRIDQALFEFRDADAVVFDLRGNPGGLGMMATGVAGHLFAEPTSLGVMKAQGATLDFKTNPRSVDPAGKSVGIITAPVAILMDGQTGSTSEIFAAGLIDHKRVQPFGQTSAGAALPATTHNLRNGDVLLHAIGDFRTQGGFVVEGAGVSQAIGVAPTRADYTSSTDPELRDALKWIQSRSIVGSKQVPSSTPPSTGTP